MSSEADTSTPARRRSTGRCHSRRAREDSRERRLLSIPAAAALPLVHRRTTAGRAGTRAQRIGPGPRVVREGNGLRRRYRPRRSGGRRRLRDKLREYYEGRSEPVLISLPKGSYVPVFEANSVFPTASTHATHTVVPPGLQQMPPAVSTPLVPHLGRTRIAVSALGGRRRDRRRACLALTPQSRERSDPAAPARLVPRGRRATGVVARRQPRRLRLVGPGRDWSDGYLRESRRE